MSLYPKKATQELFAHSQSTPITPARGYRCRSLTLAQTKRSFSFPLEEYVLLFLEVKERLLLISSVRSLWLQRGRFCFDLSTLKLPAWRLASLPASGPGYKVKALTLTVDTYNLDLNPSLAGSLSALELDARDGYLNQDMYLASEKNAEVALTSLAAYSKLKKLLLHGLVLPDLSFCKRMPLLEEVAITGYCDAYVRDVTLQLADPRQLRKLIAETVVLSVEFPNLNKCCNLEELSLAYRNVKLCLEGMESLPKLKKMRLASYNLALALKSCPTLEELKLESITLKEGGMDECKWSKLKKLELVQVRKLRQLDFLATCSELEELSLLNVDANFSEFDFQACSKLRKVRLSHKLIPASSLFVSCSKLEELEIFVPRTRAQAPLILDLGRLGSLLRCKLELDSFSLEQENFLAASRELRSFSFRGVAITSPEFLTNFPKLTTLKLTVQSFDLNKLLVLTQLEKLSLALSGGVELAPEEEKVLPRLRKLKLSLRQSRAGSVLNVGSFITALTSLVELELVGVSFPKDRLALTNKPCLEKLVLGHTKLVRIDIGQCSALESLLLVNNYCLTELEGLANLTRLSQLELHKCDALTKLEEIESITSLKRLSLVSLASYDAVLDLSKLKRLVRVTISGLDKLSQLPILAGCSALQHLAFDECPALTQVHLAACPALTELEAVCEEGETTLAANFLHACPKLKKLHLRGGAPSNEHAFFTKLSELEQLSIVDAYTIKSLDLNACVRLRSLELSHPLFLIDLSCLKECRQLEELKLDEAKKLTSLAGLEAHPSLHSLLVSKAVALVEISALATCTRLRQVQLTRTQITNLEPLGTCYTLRNLDLTGATRLSSLQGLAGLPNLEAIRLVGTAVFDFAYLQNCPRLRLIQLASTFKKARAVALRKLLANTVIALVEDEEEEGEGEGDEEGEEDEGDEEEEGEGDEGEEGDEDEGDEEEEGEGDEGEEGDEDEEEEE